MDFLKELFGIKEDAQPVDAIRSGKDFREQQETKDQTIENILKDNPDLINNFNTTGGITDLQPQAFNTLNNFYNQLTTPVVGNLGIMDLANTAKTLFDPTPFGIATLGVEALRALGNTESPTDKFNLEIGREFGDPYGYKSQLTSGTLGSRQDPFGRNLVSGFDNYEKNRMKEVARLSALQNLNKFQKDKLDFGKNYLEQLETKRQAKIQEMQDRNRATRTGGYQYGTQGGGGGAGRGFMEGSGTAKDMGSF
jgi:hypothetical protein